MNFNNYTTKTLIGISFCFVLLTACKKDGLELQEPATVSFPEKSTVVYGEQLLISVPEQYNNSGTLRVEFSAEQTKDYVFTDGTTLQQKLVASARYDAEQKAIIVDSRLLYPTGAVSIMQGQVLPSQYTLTVRLAANQQLEEGVGYLHLHIVPATVGIEGTEQDGEIAFAYGLYGEEESSFALSATEEVKTGAEWYLPATAFVEIGAGKIIFDPRVSDGKGEEETVINSQPALIKDDFVVAHTPFRMIFIPKIKYLFGQYYSDLDITIDFSLVHIGLSNGYLSAPPVFYPDKYKSTFHLKATEKDGVPFDNADQIFEVEESSGRVRVKPSDRLTEGSYKVYVEAVSSTGLVFVTTLTLGMS